jgi:Amt family ammonium transporter
VEAPVDPPDAAPDLPHWLPLQQVFEAFLDLYFHLDSDGTIRGYGARRSSDLFVPPGKFVGRRMSQVLPPGVGREFEAAMARLHDTGAPVSIEYVLELGGEERAFEAKLLPAVEPGGRITVAAREVTATLRAEGSRRGQQEQLRAVLSAAPIVVFAADCEGVLSLAEGRGLELLGLEPGEVVGQSLFEIGRGFPSLVESARRALKGEPFTQAIEIGELCFETSYSPTRDADGVVSGFIGVATDITPRRNFEESLRETEARYRGIFENAIEGIFQTTPEGRYLSANPALATLYGYDSPQELINSVNSIEQQVYLEPGRRAEFVRQMARCGSIKDFESPIRRRDGSVRWVSENSRAVCGPDGVLLGYEGTTIDITDRKRAQEERRQAEEALRQSEERLRDIVEHSSNLFYSRTPDNVLTYVSPQSRAFLDCEPDQAPRQWSAWVSDSPQNDEGLLATWRAVETGLPQPVYRLELQSVLGRRLWVEVNEAPVMRDGRAVAIVGALVDVTRRTEIEAELQHQAFHDSLTGLPNRALFMDRLQHALALADRSPLLHAVLFLDLDRFKVVNDSLGHEVGDQLLQAVARRIKNCLRPGDTAARLGGDEFTVLIESITDVNDAIHIAERIAQALQEPLSLGGHEVFVTSSIGITLSQPDDTPDAMLRDADVAMYRAKAKGRSQHEVFDPEMNARAIERLSIETDLWQAIERGELRVFYQPKVRLTNAKIVGLEALVRWEHPRHGLISPADFIPVAEETGSILLIGAWVLREACRQARAWQDARPAAQSESEPLQMSVNLSARQLVQPDLAAQVATILRETGLAARHLKLEITESVVMGDAEASIKTLRELKNLGVQLAIDDFGTGYSSLSYLRRFPVNTLKIDRSFVSGLGTSAEDTEIVRAIISLARALNLEVTAEGIETRAQADELELLACDWGQGFYFSKPLPGDIISTLLSEQSG